MKRLGLVVGLLLALCGASQAQFKGGGGFGAPGFTSPVAVGGGGATTTLDPANIVSGTTLSGGNLTATNDASAQGIARSIASHSTGKFYLEIAATAVTGSTGFGVTNSSEPLGNFLGQTANSVGYFSAGTVFSVSTLSTIQTYAAADNVGMAVDIGGKLIWFRGNGGNWNNSGTANPATGAGGISLSGLNAGPYFAGVVMNGGGTVTFNFGGTAYSFAAPAGFGNW